MEREKERREERRERGRERKRRKEREIPSNPNFPFQDIIKAEMGDEGGGGGNDGDPGKAVTNYEMKQQIAQVK